LSRAGLRQLRSLVAERSVNSWRVGDVLLAAFGPPGPSVVHDGSYERLQPLADELGVSRQWLTSCRAAAAAWPSKERRPSVAWAVHRLLVSHPDRIAKLDRFVKHCARQQVTPSHAALRLWLDSLVVEQPTLGRPRADPAVKLERMALALDTEALARLVERLEGALRSRRLTLAS
jgi:hypothetical protein